jgi:hypothetical protein
MPMMVNDGSLGAKQLMAVLLDQDFGMDASKNKLHFPFASNISEQKPYQPSVTTHINLLLIHSIIS